MLRSSALRLAFILIFAPAAAIAADAPKEPAKAPVKPPAGEMARLPGGTVSTMDGSLKLKPFQLDVTEVTVAAYAACVKAGKCKPAGTDEPFCNGGKTDRADHPINCVDFAQATAFCKWAGKRLPTEPELTWATQGATEEGTSYPWPLVNGEEVEPADQLCWDGGSVQRSTKDLGTCAVGSFPAGDSPQGLKDLVGNVSEWTSTPGDDATFRRVRAGTWQDADAGSIGANVRNESFIEGRAVYIGIRCAKGP
jgi:formylglycine-generating enzyme required for sulfatase activity